MHTPTKTQWQTVIDNLKKVLPMAVIEGHLDMMEGCGRDAMHACGTIHCFGGWYAVSVLADKRDWFNYDDGANEMAIHLGLKQEDRDGEFSIEEWALENPDIWGNNYGSYLFINAKAFFHKEHRPAGAENLKHIIDHLEEVRDRSPE